TLTLFHIPYSKCKPDKKWTWFCRHVSGNPYFFMKPWLLSGWNWTNEKANKIQMKSRYLLLLIISFLATINHHVFATHIRAGEIIAERISVQTLTYRITVVGYTDTGSSVVFGPGEINFGDGRKEVLNTESEVSTVESLGNQIEKHTFIIIHTYHGPGN